jgi:metal-responsive CopG/Arc/MetJ family transcriptional regulator
MLLREARYNAVILIYMKTAISVPDETFQRVEQAAKRLGVSRSEFYARAAQSWLDALEDEDTTEAINLVVEATPSDSAFTDAAAVALAAGDED